MMPPRASIDLGVRSKIFCDYEGAADSNTELLLENGTCMARGIVQLHDG